MNFFNYNDDRLKKINAVKEESARMSVFEQADKLFGSKKWEDDWKRIYAFSGVFGVLGNIVSIILGLSGGIYLTYDFTQNWALAFLVGAIVVLVMEVVKSVAIREATVHGLKKNMVSFGIFSFIAIGVLIASAYFSIESGMQTPYFKELVSKKTNTGAAPTLLPSVSEYDKQIQKRQDRLAAIEKERAAYVERNPKQTAKWLKADEAERLMSEIEAIKKDQKTKTAEIQQTQIAATEKETAASLSWWYWAIVIMSELCVLFGFSFSVYYLFKCRELALIEGKQIKREEVTVDSAPTHYEAVQIQQVQPTELELLKRELEQLKQKPDITPKSAASIGFLRDKDSVSTVNTSVNTVITEGQTAQTIALTDNTPEEMLLAAYRASNGSILSRKDRTTEQASVAIQYHKDRQQKIIDILEKRGKTIKMVNRAYSIVDLT
ncbi:MAG TPA: hypothetical protein P5564_06340 [Paludibacteraceae bacterium]|nr:hypothetical protein [Paludibacteraceae bacterium]